MQVVGSTRLGTGTGQAHASEGLYAHDCADHVAIDVHIADAQRARHALCQSVDARVNAKGQAITETVDGSDQRIEIARTVTHHVHDGTENFTLERVSESISTASGAKNRPRAPAGAGAR